MLKMLNFIKSSRRFDVFLNCLINNRKHLLIAERSKYNEKKRTYERKGEEDDDEEIESDEKDDEFNFKGDVIKTYETQTPRVDKILKVCLKISRKSIEDIFYQTKIRVNGRILKKKSANANIGDEIDVINGFAHENSKLINVHRIEILDIKENLENLRFSVKVKKLNSLIIQNYDGSDVWKG